MSEASVDNQGRIRLPRGVRAEMNLKPDQKMMARRKGKDLFLTPIADKPVHHPGPYRVRKEDVDRSRGKWAIGFHRY